MSDITGNFGVNPRRFAKENTDKTPHVNAQNDIHGEEGKKPAINLDKDPAAISGKSLVKTSATGKKADGYKFDPKKVEEDVLEFKAFMAVKDVMEEYKQDLIAKGYDPVAAEDKAFTFAQCLVAYQNA